MLRRTIPLALLLLAACDSRTIDLGGTNTDGGGGTPPVPDASGGGPMPLTIPLTPRNKIDVLFMVDNSNSMSAMQTELKNRFNQFLQPFTDLASVGVYADLHLGVVTSDYGAGATGAPGCDLSPGGQKGKLQAVGKYADASCLPPVGANYAAYVFAANGAGANNLPSGQSLLQTFTCMASVGSNGCGFEHQLESVYAALHNGLVENQGFLPDDAMLAVVFVTNEDDSSAPPTTDMFDRSLTNEYGFEDSYRQTRFGVICCPPGMSSCTPDQRQLTPYGDSMGPLAQCQPAPNPSATMGPQGGREYDVSRYIDLFTKPASQGGVKANPDDVLLAAIDAPDMPVQIILSNPGTAGGQPYQQCPTLNESSNPPCVPVLQHSCQNPAQQVFFGDPAVRLDTVVRAALHNTIASICDDDYSGALQAFANQMVSRMGLGCVPSTIDLTGDVYKACTVEDRTTNMDGTVTVTPIPGCIPDGNLNPCWSFVQAPECAAASGFRFSIYRGVGVTMPPANTTTTATCVPPA